MKKLTEEEIAKKLKDMSFNQLDGIYEACETAASEYNSKSIPLGYLKLCIDTTKKGFSKGFKKK